MSRPKILPRILAEKELVPSHLEGPSNEMQAAFVRHYATAGINGKEAAALAGYAAPGKAAYELLRKPHVRALVRQERESIINGDLAKLALETLGQLMTSETTPAAVKHSAARTSLEMAGHLGKAPETALADRPLAELSVAELQRLVEEGEKALASVNIVPAKVVSPPLNAPTTPQP